MAISKSRFKTNQKAQREWDKGGGGDNSEDFKLSLGETWYFFIAAVPYPPDPISGEEGDVAFLTIRQHKGLGRYGEPCIGEANKELWFDEIQAHLRGRKTPLVLDPDDGCPGCEAMDENSPEFDPDLADEMKLEGQERGFFCVIPWDRMQGDERVAVSENQRIPRTLPASPQLRRRLAAKIESLIDDDADVSDPDAARLLKVIVTNSKKERNNYYVVEADAKTLTKPLVLPPAQRRLLKKAQARGGSCDLYGRFGRYVKTRKVLLAGLRGDSVAHEEEGGDPSKPSCYGKAGEYSPTDEYCGRCAEAVECAGIVGAEPPHKAATKPQETKKPEPEVKVEETATAPEESTPPPSEAPEDTSLNNEESAALDAFKGKAKEKTPEKPATAQSSAIADFVDGL